MCRSKESFASLPYYEGNAVDSWPLRLDVHHEWKGFWWLPDSPDRRMSGVLKFNPGNGLTLSLSFPSGEAFSCPPSLWKVLFGEADGQKLTLFDCFPNPPSPKDLVGYQCGNAPQLQVKVEKVLVNAHCKTNASFHSVEFSFVGLSKWVGMSAPGGASRATGATSLPGSAEVEIREKSGQNAEANGKRIVYNFSLGYTSSSYAQESVANEAVYLRVSSSEGLALEEALEKVRLMQELVAFALQDTPNITWVRLRIDSLEDLDRQSDSKVDLLYSPSLVGKYGIRSIEEEMPLFTCKHLSFERAVRLWCEKRDSLRGAISMIMSLYYAPSPYVESNLLMVVGAAEVLHRELEIREKLIRVSNRGFRTIRDCMLDGLPAEYQQYKNRFRAAIRNEPSLEDRLLDLAKRLDQDDHNCLGLDVSKWAELTKLTRNKLVHTGKVQDSSLEKLDAIVEVTKAVVVFNLLKEFRLPFDCWLEIMCEHPYLSRAARLLKDCLTGGSEGRFAIRDEGI